MTYNKLWQSRCSFIENYLFFLRGSLFPGTYLLIECGCAMLLGDFLVLVLLRDYVDLPCHLKISIFNVYPICVHFFISISIPLFISHISLRKSFLFKNNKLIGCYRETYKICATSLGCGVRYTTVIAIHEISKVIIGTSPTSSPGGAYNHGGNTASKERMRNRWENVICISVQNDRG